MIFRPFNTLAGRLVLVTIAAIAVSHAIAFSLFFNERNNSFRKAAESNVIERVAAAHERLRETPPQAYEQVARAASGRFIRFSIVDAPIDAGGLHAARRIAHAVSDQISGEEVRASTIQQEIDWPPRGRRGRDAEDRRPPPDGELRPPPERPRERRLVEIITVDAALPNRQWVRAVAFMPAPTPVPPSFWVAAIVSMLAVSAGAVLVARQIAKPLAQMAAAADRLGQGDTNVSAPVSGPSDVQRAASAFNTMAVRLGRQLNRQRQMLWALSHDLRTPITALKLRAELIEDEGARERLTAPIDEMERLTEQALALARAGASEEARSSVDLAEIARTLCGELADLGVNVRAEAPSPVMAPCRPSEIARALRNLAENAARYGGGGVMAVYRDTNGDAVMEVTDEGPGVSAELIERLTEPFFRADAARSTANGAGLGLAIAQAIAEAHGGRLVLANRTPRGFSAKLILPG